jgi:hypothetical protein
MIYALLSALILLIGLALVVKKVRRSKKEKQEANIELYFDDGSQVVISSKSPYYKDFRRYADELLVGGEKGRENG